MNAILDLIKNHTSIRKFNDQPVTEEEEQAVIACAIRGATAGNMMQYSIISIRNKETLAKLAESCDQQPFIATAGLALLFVADTHKWQRFFELRKVTDHGNPYSKPRIPDLMLGIQDSMIAAQNCVIAAESLGLGTCYIGDIMEQAEYHRELFQLPAYTMPVTLIVFGHYDSKPQLRSRFDPQYMVFKEVYQPVNEAFINGMFFKEEQKQEDFAQKFYSRKIEAAFFKEMTRSLKIYLGQWLGE
jgi:FMN reductase (NADPH)